MFVRLTRGIRRMFVFTALSGMILTPIYHIQSQKLEESAFEKPSDAKYPTENEVIGVDGDYTVTAANTVLNRYTALAANVSAGATSFQVANVSALDSPIPQLGPLAPGDLLMLIQMQGASINSTDSVNYGSVTALNGAGNYELVTVGSIDIFTNTITINGEGCITGLRKSYTTNGRTQVIRVPQFQNLTINTGASIVAPAWNGTLGGVVALQVSRFLTINGSISATGLGFRGGALDNSSNIPGTAIYRSTNAGDGAEKGEGIAGDPSSYPNGRYGRGAPANAGGGGNAHNSGGGGGANGNNGNTWTGQGVMPNTPASAWALDPGYIAAGGFTNSSGGGRGGYTYSANNRDATSTGPGNTLWGGDNRQERGGLGGRPVNNDPAGTLFMGGGGGAGDANNSAGGAGGNGGGIIWLQAGTISGTGSITSNGNSGSNTTGGGNDAPGGGGAGGTIVVSSFALAGVTITANGGTGGNQIISSNEAEGPGGGGGGGYIAIRTGSPSRSANGGVGGNTDSTSLTEFPRNGSTNGASGVANATVSTLPICVSPSAGPTTVVGQVVDAYGRAIGRARLTLIDGNGNIQVAISNAFGYFKFAPIPSGSTATLTVSHKGYTFASPTQIIETRDSIAEILFIAD